jgi:hypothetical protein
MGPARNVTYLSGRSGPALSPDPLKAPYGRSVAACDLRIEMAGARLGQPIDQLGERFGMAQRQYPAVAWRPPAIGCCSGSPDAPGAARKTAAS